MHQVGQTKIFALSATSGSQIYSYVWKFWDGTSEATPQPAVEKVLNMGGDPTDDRNLQYSCTLVAVNGAEVAMNGSLQVNNPPSIVPSPTISENDTYLPFSTRLRLDAYDLDEGSGDTPLTFDWYLGSYYLGNGTLGTPYSFNGSWAGNGIVVVQSLTAQPCYYDTTVYGNRVIRCYVQDYSGGVTYVDFDLRGYVRPALETGIVANTANLGSDSSALPIKRIGFGEYFEFIVDARDAANDVLNFSWNCAGSNDWTVPSTGAGAVSQNPDGSWRSVYIKDLTNEVVSSGTQKTSTAVCTVISPSARTDVSISVILVKNSGPTNVTISIRDAVTGNAIVGSTARGTKIQYEAIVTDPDNDIGYVFWYFDSAAAVEWPQPTQLVGPKVIVDTDLWPSPAASVRGTFIAVDRLLQPSYSGSVPTVMLT